MLLTVILPTGTYSQTFYLQSDILELALALLELALALLELALALPQHNVSLFVYNNYTQVS